MAHRIKLAPEVVWVVSEKDKKDLKGRQLWASQEKGGGGGIYQGEIRGSRPAEISTFWGLGGTTRRFEKK